MVLALPALRSCESPGSEQEEGTERKGKKDCPGKETSPGTTGLTCNCNAALAHWASQVAQWVESTCNAGDAGDSGSIPGLGRASGGGHGNPLQYSCLENSVDTGAWRATVHGVAPCSLLEELAGSSTVAVLASLPLRAPTVPLPQGLCTCCFLYLEQSSSRFLQEAFPHSSHICSNISFFLKKTITLPMSPLFLCFTCHHSL